MKRFITLALWLCAAVSQAANIAVGPSATGSGSGADWNNLRAWSAAPVRGDTWYLVDGSYTGKLLNTAVSGSSLITIKKATVADHGGITTGWSNALGDGQAVFNGNIQIATAYWVFDGVTGGGPGQWTTNFGFKVAATSSFVGSCINFNFSGGANVTIRHCELQGHGPDDAVPGSVTQDAISGQTVSNVTVSYVYAHSTGRCIFYAGGGTNWIFEYCYLGKGEATAGQHAETMQLDGVNNITIRWNIFRYAVGTGLIMMHGNDIKIYGNVFYPDPALGAWDNQNGVIAGWSSGNNITNSTCHNNTFVNISGTIFGGSSSASGNAARNNYFYLCPLSGIHGLWTPISNNHWQSSNTPNGTSITTGSGDPFASGALTGLTFALASNTTAGFPLPAPYNVDWNGNTRTTWTRGAVEFSGVDSTLPTLLPAPNGVVVQSDGLTWRFSFSETVTTSGAGWTTSMSGGAVTLSAFSASGNVITATGSRQVAGGEFGTVSYAQPGNGVQDPAGNDLASLSGFTVTNQAIINQVETPGIPLAGGLYYGTQNVAISTATSGATIYYTLDGSTPSTSSNVYSGPIPVSSPVLLQTFAAKSGMGNSDLASASYQVATWGSNNDFQNIIGIPQQTGVFTWSFRVTPPEANVATHIGLSPTTVDDFDDWAVIIRLNSVDSSFDVRNGAAYDSDAIVVYAGGTSYDVVVVVDITKADQEILSVSVAPAGGSPTVIATNYDFRTSQDAATELDGVGMLTTVSTQPSIVTNMTFVPGVPGGGGAGVVPSASNLMISDP